MTKTVLDELSDVLGDGAGATFEVTHWLDTGFPPLNKVISGDYRKGLPVGRLVEMFGMQSCGKTAIATCAMKSAIDQGGFALFHDHERSFDMRQARNLGLDPDTGRFAHLRPETAEESFTRAIHAAQRIREKSLIPPDAPIIAVFDSLAAMVPRAKWEKELTELTMADSLALAKATSTVLPVVKQAAEKYNMLVLLLNQLRENPGVTYGDNTRTPGGKAPPFYADVRIKLTAAKLVQKDGGETRQIGQQITADIVKNKVYRPFLKTRWDFLFNEDGTGSFDVVGGMIDHLVEIGVLTQSGPRITYNGKSYFKSQLVAHVKENDLLPELIALLP